MYAVLQSLDLAPVWLSLKLAGLTTVILLIFTTPLAWWLAFTDSRLKPVIHSVVTLPLVLPPTVLGFYLLILLGPHGWLGQLTSALGVGSLAFTFSGLVFASCIYSLPFSTQALHTAFLSVGKRPLEVAATLGAGPLDRFFSVVLPLSRHGFISAAVLSFAHTLGEFGVVLMIGGNIPGETKVLSMAIYEHVEGLQYTQAHLLSAALLIFSFTVLLILQLTSSTQRTQR